MKYFKLFECCIPVKGASRSVICDLQKREIQPIPNALFNILSSSNKMSLEDILIQKVNSEEDKSVIIEYFDFLVENEYGFWCDSLEEVSLFIKMPLDWHHAGLISNSIIDLTSHSTYDVKKFIREVSSLGCEHIQIRSYSDRTCSYFEDIMAEASYYRILSIEVITKSIEKQLNLEDWKKLCHDYKQIRSITFHSAQYNKIEQIDSSGMGNIFSIVDKIDSDSHCGLISSEFFFQSLNVKAFTESLKFNSCLNRKLSIDCNGMICNCPSMPERYGNINNTNLYSIAVDSLFQKYWGINKDQIEVCKQCEFRYVCTDCRAYIKDENNIYSKPYKCTYNPSTLEWQ